MPPTRTPLVTETTERQRERQNIVEIIRALALEAGAEIMRFYATDFTVENKPDDSPVTAADRAADAIIVAGLQRHFPHIPVVTEERDESHDAARDAARFFLVDPLDGTREFVSRNGEFTVNIALGRKPNSDPGRGPCTRGRPPVLHTRRRHSGRGNATL